MDIVTNLLSGFIGAAVGAWATLQASKKTLDGLYTQEKERRVLEEKERKKEALQAFYIETEENLESINRWKATHDYFRLGIDAWDLYKSHVKKLKAELVQKLVKAYSEIRRHNTSIDYHIELLANAHERNVGIERNLKQRSLENGVSGVENALNSLKQELVKTLNKISQKS